MTEETVRRGEERKCPSCECVIVDTGYEKEGITYCCEACANDGDKCTCGCSFRDEVCE